MKKTLLFVSFCTLTNISIAKEYQFEFYGSYSKSDYEYDGGFESDGTYSYISSLISFQPVDMEKGPYSETLFLNKSSFIRVNAGKSNNTFSSRNNSVSVTVKDKDYGLVINKVLNEQLIVFVDYDKTESDSEEFYGLGLGTYITDTATVTWSYDVYESEDYSDAKVTSLLFYSLNNLGEDKAISYSFGAYYGKYENFEGKDSASGLYGSLDYYFNKSFGLGGSFSYVEDDGDQSVRLGLNTEYFLRPEISMGLRYRDYGLSDRFEGETYSVFTRVRF